MAAIPHPHPEDLLAQAGWMRALALGLLTDPGAADDVVQETWIAALEHAPGAEGSLRGWLARVLRNRASKRRRSEQRRAAHETAVAPPEVQPGPAATAERLELQRELLAALAEVPEPFRTAVVERYLEGRTSADVARALGVPEGTVRWRLKKGLDDLRARLDQRFGERETWCAALIACLPNSVTPASAVRPGALLRPALEPGLLVMVGTSKLVLTAVAGVALAGLLLWKGQSGPRGAADTSLRAAQPEVVAPPAPLNTPAPSPSAPAEREALAVAPAAEAPESKPPVTSPPAETNAQLRVRFVDTQGAPWPGVELAHVWRSDARATSDTQGRVELALAPENEASEWTAKLVARRSGCTARVLRVAVTAGRTTDLGDVVLAPGGRIEGRVVSAATVGIEGVEVGLASPELFDEEREDEEFVRRNGSDAFERILTTRTGPGGTFVLDGIGEGRWRVWAHDNQHRYGWSEPFEVRAGADVFGMELVLPDLERDDRITGVVLDPLGKPVPKARLLAAYESEFEGSSTTLNVGDDGRFDLRVRRPASYTLSASDPDQRYADALVEGIAPGALDVELRLGEKRLFQVSVHDAEGRAVEGCRFLIGKQVSISFQSDVKESAVIEPGLYELERPATSFQLEVECSGFLPARFEDLRPESVGAHFDVVLARAPILRGRVIADGKPVAGARVTLHRALVDRGLWFNDFVCVYEFQVDQEGTTDAEGRFELTCTHEGTQWLRATSPGWAAAEAGPLEPHSAGDLTLELTEGGAIEGRVLLPDGADAEGVIVGINHGDGRGQTQRAGPEGRFFFSTLTPGNWQVRRCEAELDPSTTTSASSDQVPTIEWNCTVAAGKTTRYDLDLTVPEER